MFKNIVVVFLILLVDFSCLGEEIKVVDEVGVDWIYVDVMDGCFVFNIIIGLLIVDVICFLIKKILDVYLMIVELEKYVEDFVKVGVDIIFVYVEYNVFFYFYCIFC